MQHTSYKGRHRTKSVGSKYRDWAAYTVAMGMLPLVIRLLLASSFDVSIGFEDFRTELFFITIVLLVDALRNYELKSGIWAVALLVLIASAAVYAVILGFDLDLYKSEISNENINHDVRRFLLAGAILDIPSVGMGGGSDV